MEKRLIVTKTERSENWTENDIIEVVKSLKNGKCQDPLGLISRSLVFELIKDKEINYLCSLMCYDLK